jgi:hypothetical protein
MLTVNQGEKLRVVQTHDDNMNGDWWLLERSGDQDSTLKTASSRGFVPSSYVRQIV